MKFLSSIDLSKQELQNAVLQNLAVAPGTPKRGQAYYNTVDNKPYIWDGTQWKDMTSSGEGASIILNGTSTSEAALYAPITGGTSGDELVSKGTGSAPVWRNQRYSVCSTAGSTTAKIVTFDNINLVTGLLFSIKFAFANTAVNPTLNIGNSGAKAIYYGGALVSNTNSWRAEETVLFIYDGIYWKSVASDTFGNNKLNKISSPIANRIPVINSDGTLSTGNIDITDIITESLVGVANGICPLDENNKIPSTHLPAYIDDVVSLLSTEVFVSASEPTIGIIDQYYYNSVNSILYKCTVPSETTPTWIAVSPNSGDRFYDNTNKKIYTFNNGGWVSPQTPVTGVIYIDIYTNKTYRWGGESLIVISESNIHKYVGNIVGNNSTTAFTINHGLNTREVIVNIYEEGLLYQQVFCDVYMTSTTAITVVFSTAPNIGYNYKVIIVA